MCRASRETKCDVLVTATNYFANGNKQDLLVTPVDRWIMFKEPIITNEDTGLPESSNQKLSLFRMRSDCDDQLYVMSDPSFRVFSPIGITGHDRRFQLLHLEVLSLRIIPVNARCSTTCIQQAFDCSSFPSV